MERHVKILGIIHIVHSLLAFIAGVSLLILLSGIGLLSGNVGAASILVIIGVGIALFLLILATPGLIGGVGLLMLKPWSRILVLVLGFLNLLELPIGTALGVYTLWVLLHDETVEIFDHAQLAVEGY